MFNKLIPFLTLMVFGVSMTSCDQNELEEVTTEKTASVQNATTAGLFLEETFEGSNPMDVFHGLEILSTSYSFQLASNPVFEGKKSGRIELRDTDPLESNGTRAEMVPIKDKMQKEMWFSFAVYLPAADFARDSEKEILSQWHQSGGSSPPSFLQIEADKWGYWVASNTENHTKYDLGAVAKNTWNQFVFHYIQSNGSDGLVEVWLNGKKMVTHKGGNIYALSNLPKWKLGIYKWKWNGSETTDVSKRVLYYDNIRVGTAQATYAGMAAGGTSPVVEEPAEEETSGEADASLPTENDGSADSQLPVPAPVANLTFINAEVDKDYKPLTNGSSLDLAAMGSKKVSIRADFGSAQVGSAKFVVTGAKNYTFIDNAKPFALFGDSGTGNYYYGSYLPVGNYTMTVTPYSGTNGGGTAGTPVTVNFTITDGANKPQPTVPAATFTFVNAQVDKDYKPLTNGSSLSLSAMGSPKVNIRADFGTALVGSVKFTLSGSKNYTYTDNAAPYAMFGDDGKGNYFYGSYLPVGSYTLTAMPYSSDYGKGTAGTPVTVKFTVVK